MSLYEQLGGADAIDAVVEEFYRRVLADDRISAFFDGVDMSAQAAKQKAFITMALGGPNNYTGQDMAQGHAALVERGLDDSHVDAVIENLDAVLGDVGVGSDERATVKGALEGLRDAVLNRASCS